MRTAPGWSPNGRWNNWKVLVPRILWSGTSGRCRDLQQEDADWWLLQPPWLQVINWNKKLYFQEMKFNRSQTARRLPHLQHLDGWTVESHLIREGHRSDAAWQPFGQRSSHWYATHSDLLIYSFRNTRRKLARIHVLRWSLLRWMRSATISRWPSRRFD